MESQPRSGSRQRNYRQRKADDEDSDSESARKRRGKSDRHSSSHRRSRDHEADNRSSRNAHESSSRDRSSSGRRRGSTSYDNEEKRPVGRHVVNAETAPVTEDHQPRFPFPKPGPPPGSAAAQVGAKVLAQLAAPPPSYSSPPKTVSGRLQRSFRKFAKEADDDDDFTSKLVNKNQKADGDKSFHRLNFKVSDTRVVEQKSRPRSPSPQPPPPQPPPPPPPQQQQPEQQQQQKPEKQQQEKHEQRKPKRPTTPPTIQPQLDARQKERTKIELELDDTSDRAHTLSRLQRIAKLGTSSDHRRRVVARDDVSPMTSQAPPPVKPESSGRRAQPDTPPHTASPMHQYNNQQSYEELKTELKTERIMKPEPVSLGSLVFGRQRDEMKHQVVSPKKEPAPPAYTQHMSRDFTTKASVVDHESDQSAHGDDMDMEMEEENDEDGKDYPSKSGPADGPQLRFPPSPPTKPGPAEGPHPVSINIRLPPPPPLPPSLKLLGDSGKDRHNNKAKEEKGALNELPYSPYDQSASEGEADEDDVKRLRLRQAKKRFYGQDDKRKRRRRHSSSSESSSDDPDVVQRVRNREEARRLAHPSGSVNDVPCFGGAYTNGNGTGNELQRPHSKRARVMRNGTPLEQGQVSDSGSSSSSRQSRSRGNRQQQLEDYASQPERQPLLQAPHRHGHEHEQQDLQDPSASNDGQGTGEHAQFASTVNVADFKEYDARTPVLHADTSVDDSNTPRYDHFTPFFTKKYIFSNHYPCRLDIDGRTFVCTEQYYMWVKAKTFGDNDAADRILNSKDPKEMKRAGSGVKNFSQNVWSMPGRMAMLLANYVKVEKDIYKQHRRLRLELFRTAGTTLVECNPSDERWGIALPINDPRVYDPSQWRGENWLGEMLTRLRDTMAKCDIFRDDMESVLREQRRRTM